MAAARAAVTAETHPLPLLAPLAVCQSSKSPAVCQVRPGPCAVALPFALGGPGRSLPGLTAATMSSFSESALEKKLSELSNSQQSVQTLSLWLIHHRKHAGPIVSVWHRELRKGKHPRSPRDPPVVALPHRYPGPSSFLTEPCFFQVWVSDRASEIGDSVIPVSWRGKLRPGRYK